MILLARESRGLTLQALADATGSNKAQLSRMENGDTKVSEDLLNAISAATGYPNQFFFQKGGILPVNLAYRKRQHVPSKIIVPVEAQINIMRMHTELLTGIMKTPPPKIPVYKVTAENTPAVIAGLVRKDWNIKAPVITHLLQLLEQKGIFIHAFDFGTERIDSKSILTSSQFPIIFLNATLLGDRQRFSLAHELGHLVMHSFNIVSHERNIGHEANEFAAEFLMPADEIIHDFKNDITISLLGELKRKWKVSMISLLYRADDLGLLTPNQKRTLLQRFNQLRIRRREPAELDIPAEEPALMRRLAADCKQYLNLHISDMANLLSLQESEYIDLYGEIHELSKSA